MTRRALLSGIGAGALAASLPALAQAPQPQPAQPASVAPQPRFSYDNVLRRARELSAVAFEEPKPALPEVLAKLEFDAWREIRFRPERAFLPAPSPYRMHMFHPGFLFTRPVTIHVVRDGLATPVPYSAQLFDYGKTRFERPLPVNLGFAGFRLHHPLNDPRTFDELISFIGASYFRFLGRGQKYGLSARGLAINAGVKDGEEFPFFREFWVETPAADADRATIYALMDSPSLTGAYRFHVYPGEETVVSVTATIFPRKRLEKFGIAPLTSMFFTGENDRRYFDDYRSELHDSDGLLVHNGSGEWLWRPLRNPKEVAISAFVDKGLRGFGLMQRDRVFEHYQDLDLNYELRPSYWIEPEEEWGEGHVELIELPTADETNDNIVAQWVPRQPLEPGREAVFRYRIKSLTDADDLHPGGRAINTYQAKPKALGSGETVPPGARRFIVDFAGGDLAYHLADPDKVQLVPSISAGRITRAFVVANPKTEGFRAFIDVLTEPNQPADIRAFLKAGSKALTETWLYPWRGE